MSWFMHSRGDGVPPTYRTVQIGPDLRLLPYLRHDGGAARLGRVCCRSRTGLRLPAASRTRSIVTRESVFKGHDALRLFGGAPLDADESTGAGTWDH